jgi:hypothetical protein
MKFLACCILAVALASTSACKREPDLSRDPAAVGQTVTLTGKVKEVYDPTILEVKTDRGDVIVIAPPSPPPMKKGDRVTVTGDVRQVTLQEFSQRYRADVYTPIRARIEEENVVTANTIKPS